MAIPVAPALEAIKSEGAFVLEDSKIGEQVLNFDKEIKTPDGFNFLARNSLDNPEILQITQSLLTRPYWTFVKIYSDVLPSDYAFSFHTGRTRVALAIQLWSPGSTFTLLEGSHQHIIKEGDIDKKVSNEWGLLAARLDLPEAEHRLEQGGLVMADSRQWVRVLRGQCITIGYTSENMLQHIGEMLLPYSQEFEETLNQLKLRGFNIRYKWKQKTTGSPST